MAARPEDRPTSPSGGTRAPNVLVLYADTDCHTQTVQEHLLSFRRYGRFQCFYANAVEGAACNVPLGVFDVVVIHYSACLYYRDYFSPAYADALRRFTGLKVAFAQDEYDWTENLRDRIGDLGIQVFFTCVPEPYVEAVYPRARFPGTRFYSTLTGFVPSGLDANIARKPVSERRIFVGYRGRALHPRYGALAREKLVIGQKMKDLCERAKLPCDIAWTEEHRIYWNDWYAFLENCRVTLGTESGSNVFDDHGEIRRAVDADLRRRPSATYEELYAKHVAPHEAASARMNQVSPRIFEAIAMRTGLVLFEGQYSGVVQPDLHYIPLRKDFGNAAEVIEKVRDERYLSEMTDRAYRDVIGSGRYSYETFIREFEAVIARHGAAPKGAALIASLVAAHRSQTPWLVAGIADADEAREQYQAHVEHNVVTFPVAADAVSTATNWPLYHREHAAIVERSPVTREDLIRPLGLRVLDGVPAKVAAWAGVYKVDGARMLVVALLTPAYLLAKLLPKRMRLLFGKAAFHLRRSFRRI